MKTILVDPPPFPFTTVNQHLSFLSRILPVGDKGCAIWAGMSSENAGVVKISKKDYRAHRVAYMLHHGPIPPGFNVGQTCGNKFCMTASHLVLINQESLKKPTAPKKPVGRPAKLTPEIVLEIRRRHFLGETYISLAFAFDICQATAFNICKRYTWKHIPPAPGQEPQQLP